MNPLKQLVTTRGQIRGLKKDRTKNPRAVFILSSPRSGSTMLRAMLAGHSKLFAPPELRMLGQDSLVGGSLPNGNIPFSSQNFLRAVEQAGGEGSADLSNMSVADAYLHLQKLIGDRTLVDKTPHYAVDPAIMDRAEQMFDKPLYIWLTRNPGGVAESFRQLPDTFFWTHAVLQLGLTPAKVGELTWSLCHENILKFTRTIPGDRVHELCYEDLTFNPAETMEGICDFLGIELEPGMLTPFDGDPDRMTAFGGGGDLRFNTRTHFDVNMIDAWRDHIDASTFEPETIALATSLGFDL